MEGNEIRYSQFEGPPDEEDDGIMNNINSKLNRFHYFIFLICINH